MVRPSRSVFVHSLPALAALLAIACSSSPDQQLIQRYFQASRMRDNATLNNIATVSFSPDEQGAVQDFDIVTEGVEERRPLKLKDLSAAEAQARTAEEEFNKNKKAYQDSNLTAIERVVKAEGAGTAVRGPDVAIQNRWTQLRDEASQHSKALADARQALSVERGLTDASVYDARNPIDATQFDGELITKNTSIRATIRKPDGTTETKDLAVGLSRTELSGGPDGRKITGRWVITSITDAGAAPS